MGIIKLIVHSSGGIFTSVDGAQTSLDCLLEDSENMESVVDFIRSLIITRTRRLAPVGDRSLLGSRKIIACLETCLTLLEQCSE